MKRTTHRHWVAAPLIVLLCTVVAMPGWALPLPDGIEADLMSHIRYLADDAREGRGIGTAGLDSSAAYIADRFGEYGLTPLFGDGYYQAFEMAWGAELQPGCYLATAEDTLWTETDLLPLGFSGIGEVSGPAWFAGFGISAPEYDYDDYAGINVQGAVVIVLEGEPGQENEESLFAGRLDTDHAMLRTKAINAKNQGAAGLVIVTLNDADTLTPLSSDEPYRDAGLPVVQVTRAGLKQLLPRLDVQKLRRSIDANETPRSMEAGEVPLGLRVNLLRRSVPVANVCGMVPGGSEVLVVGAHYDHLGYGQMGSNEQGVRVIHNGADDNASGVAVLLELARWYAEHPDGPTIWFVAFTGEEAGLVGSNHFVNNPPMGGLDEVKFMLNLDMVGRTQDRKLTVYGVASAEGLSEMASRAGDGSPLTLNLTGDGYGSSDQTSFYLKGIPVLHLLGALHEDYHTSRDDVDKINSSGLVDVLDYSIRLLNEATSNTTELVYQAKSAPDRASGRRSITVSLGTIPDFSQPDSLSGMRIQGVREGTPAAEAGLTGMDVLVRIGDVVIDNIYDFTYALKQHKPGDQVEVVYKRNGEEHRTIVTFTAAQRRH